MVTRQAVCVVLLALVTSFFSLDASSLSLAAEQQLTALQSPIAGRSVVLLKDIRSFNMPGTHKLKPDPLEPKKWFKSREGKVYKDLRTALSQQENSQKVDAAFAIAATDEDALETACLVLEDRSKPIKETTTKEDVSVFFYAIGRGSHVQIRKVERIKNDVIISYMFTPHLISPQTTHHFALIPLGRLPAGKTTVQILRLPTDKKLRTPAYVEPSKNSEAQMVSHSFEFTVN